MEDRSSCCNVVRSSESVNAREVDGSGDVGIATGVDFGAGGRGTAGDGMEAAWMDAACFAMILVVLAAAVERKVCIDVAVWVGNHPMIPMCMVIEDVSKSNV